MKGYERVHGSLKKTPTHAQYHFGAGSKLATYTVSVPLRYGSFEYEFPVDVVPGNVPLLISRKDLISMRAVVDHGMGKMIIPKGGDRQKDTIVPLTTSSTQHWVVPLRWKV